MKKFSAYLSLALLTIAVVIAPTAEAIQKVKVKRTEATIAKTYDLTIIDAEFSPSNPLIGDKIDLAVRVQNRGTSTVPAFSVSASDQTGWQTAGAGAYLEAGDNKVVHMTLYAAERNRETLLSNNPHRFQIIVDPRNLIPETYEKNNVYYKELTVYDDKAEDIRAANHQIASYVSYNEEKKIVLEWTDTAENVNYEIRFYTTDLVNGSPVDPSANYGMNYYSHSTDFGVRYYVSDDNVSEEYKRAVSTWPQANYWYYTHSGSYNAVTVYVTNERVSEFAIVSNKNGNQQFSRGVRLYYQTPETLEVDNLKPTSNSSLENGVTLTWTNEGTIDDINQYDLKYFTYTTSNPFQLSFYTQTTDAGLVYYTAESSKFISQEELDKATSIAYKSYSNGMYSAEVGTMAGTYVTVAYNPFTGLKEVGNVVMFTNNQTNTDRLATRGEIAYYVATLAEYPLPPCETAPYPDVPTDYAYCPEIQALTKAEVMVGYPDGYFHPEANSSRADVSKIEISGFKIGTYISEGAPHFSDVQPETWFYRYVETLYTYGDHGYEDGTFRPGDAASLRWVEGTTYLMDSVSENGALEIILASSPISQTQVAGAMNVPAVGVSFKANEDIVLEDVLFTGIIDENNDGVFGIGSENGIDIKQVVEYVELYDDKGNKIAPYAKSFYDGVLNFSDLGLQIPKGTTLTLVPRVKISSSAGFNNTPDVIAISLDRKGVDAYDQNHNLVTTIGENVNGKPTVTVTVLPAVNAGTLTIESGNLYNSEEVVEAGSTNVWVNQIKLTAKTEGFRVERLSLQNNAFAEGAPYPNNAAIRSVTIKYPENSFQTPEQYTGSATGVIDPSGRVNFSGFHLPVPKDTSVYMLIYTDLNTIQSGAVKTGDYVNLAFDCTEDQNNTFKAISDSAQAYYIAANEVIKCGNNNQDIQANNDSTPPVTIRKSITQVDIAGYGNLLQYGYDQSIFNFGVRASNGGDIGFGRITLNVQSIGLDQQKLAQNLKLYNMVTNSVISTANIDSNEPGKVVFNFPEETIRAGGSGSYLVTANIFDDGQNNVNSLSTQILNDNHSDADSFTSGWENTTTYEKAAQSPFPSTYNRFIWSDHSAANHNSQTPDWTNSYRLQVNTSPITLK